MDGFKAIDAASGARHQTKPGGSIHIDVIPGG